jgi:hypothetical protein
VSEGSVRPLRGAFEHLIGVIDLMAGLFKVRTVVLLPVPRAFLDFSAACFGHHFSFVPEVGSSFFLRLNYYIKRYGL